MPNYPIFNLTGKTPENTFQNLVQTNAASSSLVDGLGNEIEFFNLTASKSISASWSPSQGGTTLTTASTYPVTASWAISASSAPNLLLDITDVNKIVSISASVIITSSLLVDGNTSVSTLSASAVSLTSTTASVPTNTGSVVGWMTFQGGDGNTYYFPLYR